MEDLFGKAMMDFYRGERAKLFLERDDGYLDRQPLSSYFSSYSKWPKQEREAMKYVRGKILDVGCGAGRHLLYLQKKGFDVVGIDISPKCVEVAKLRGAKDVRAGSIFNSKFPKNSFDTILLLGNNLGIGGTVQQIIKLLKILYRITTKNGRVLAQTINPFLTKNKAHLLCHERNRKKGKFAGGVRLRFVYKGKKSAWFEWVVISPEKLKEICKATKWNIKKLISGPKTAQYIAILEK